MTNQGMSTGRIIWIVFCLGWVGFWLIFGWFLPGLNVILAILSGLAILIPIGKTTQPNPETKVRRIVPSSVFDPDFSDEEKADYFNQS